MQCEFKLNVLQMMKLLHTWDRNYHLMTYHLGVLQKMQMPKDLLIHRKMQITKVVHQQIHPPLAKRNQLLLPAHQEVVKKKVFPWIRALTKNTIKKEVTSNWYI